MSTPRRRSNDGVTDGKKSYTVVHELVTQEKKKLRTEIVADGPPPAGYTFVPVGIGDLTEYCKERSREQGLLVYIVSSSTRHLTNSNNLQLDRVGYHFENSVVTRGHQWLKLRNTNRKRLSWGPVSSIMEPSTIARHLESHGKRMGVPRQGASRQQLLAQVRETIKELFPKIPEEDLENVLARAFAEGSGTVGNAEDMPLSKKVQLAVNAHIRHTHTPYDWLLRLYKDEQKEDQSDQPQRNKARSSARADIEKLCLDLLRKWRGEEDAGPKEFEDIFREIIVIEDDSERRGPPGHTSVKARSPSAIEVSGSRGKRSRPQVGHILDDGEDDYEPPDIRSPRTNSKISTNTAELVHVRPKRAIDSSRLSNMDSLASNRSLQVRSTGFPGMYQNSPPHYHSTHQSSALEMRRIDGRDLADSVIESIEPASAIEGSLQHTKRKAPMDQLYHQQSSKVHIVDEVPENEIIHRRSRNHLTPHLIHNPIQTIDHRAHENQSINGRYQAREAESYPSSVRYAALPLYDMAQSQSYSIQRHNLDADPVLQLNAQQQYGTSYYQDPLYQQGRMLQRPPMADGWEPNTDDLYDHELPVDYLPVRNARRTAYDDKYPYR